MPGMDMSPHAATPMQMPQPQTLTEGILQHLTSGTSIEPISTPTPMLMTQRNRWTLMLHSNDFLADTQQQSANSRGHDAFFSTNWIMPMAQHSLGARGQVTLRAMFSLEPATIPHGSYPELFQQGETYQGQPIVDGQHPHDFVMELGALYDLHLPAHSILTLYAAPVGDPAIGPTAYPHRQSASEDPIAALGHHQQDSTHIAFSVLTAGLTHRAFRIEASGFHGAEPTDARWHFQPSPNGLAPDSYSARLTFAPTKNLAAQYSIAHITAPEQLSPNQDQRRQTASLMYNRPLGAHSDTNSMPGMAMPTTPATGNLAITALWGQTKSLPANQLANSYLLEALLNLRRNYLWTRIELAARTSDLLTPAAPIETTLGHVQAYTLGYDRDYRIAPHLLAAPGAQFTLYAPPAALEPLYGPHPYSAVLFIRFRLN
jgi:hypothetical protein